ncbi:MAG: hypothetical protein NVS4B6_05740 [Mycobacterium sp.]
MHEQRDALFGPALTEYRGGSVLTYGDGVLKKMAIGAAAALAAAVLLATPAAADPGDNPCGLAVSFLCRFVPVAPDLDHDVDLTQQQPVDPNAAPPDSLPIADPCAAGCI